MVFNRKKWFSACAMAASFQAPWWSARMAWSFVREQADIAVKVTTTTRARWWRISGARSRTEHRQQWFQRGPVLALLPLPGRRVSMVCRSGGRGGTHRASRWGSAVPGGAKRDAGAVGRPETGHACPKLSAAFARRTPPRRHAGRAHGDVGHRHPLAGQGLNLGLQDARALAATLAEREPARDPGDLRLLRRYERARAEPILAMDAVVGGLFSLFGAESALASRLRNAGLNLTDRVPVLKNILMRHAMS